MFRTARINFAESTAKQKAGEVGNAQPPKQEFDRPPLKQYAIDGKTVSKPRHPMGYGAKGRKNPDTNSKRCQKRITRMGRKRKRG